jgi:Flp pilus assembly CpaF family ATPase
LFGNEYTYMGTLDYFMDDKHIKDHDVNVPKDVYFGV